MNKFLIKNVQNTEKSSAKQFIKLIQYTDKLCFNGIIIDF